jgi:hypothetical protein
MPVMVNENQATFRNDLSTIGRSTEMPPVADGLTHFTRLPNTIFRPTKAIRKRGGRTRKNSTAIDSGETVHTVFQAWQMGTGGVNSQRLMSYVGTKIYSSDDYGVTNTSLKTGLEDDKIGWFSVFDDIVIWSSTSTSDVPQSWDFSSASTSNLAGSPPNFSAAVPHQNRLWAWGDASIPSRLYYSGTGDPEDWSGGGAGSIDLDPNDGDRIITCIEHLNDLWVFKGPNVGSIHRIRNAFSISNLTRDVVSRGLPAVSAHGRTTVGTDIFFVTRSGIASLAMTERFGDITESLVSDTVKTLFQDSNQARFDLVYMVHYAHGSAVMTSMPGGGLTKNNQIHIYDPVGDRWADPWELSAASLAIVVDETAQQRLYSGDYSGFINLEDGANRSDDPSNTPYTWRLRTNAMRFAAQSQMFTPDTECIMQRISSTIRPKGNYNISGVWKWDDQTDQTFALDSGLGSQGLGSFTLGTDVLGPASFAPTTSTDPEGKGKTGICQLTQAGADQDAELYTLDFYVESAGEAEDSVT